MDRQKRDLVSASEIAAYAWCPESWRLKALGHEPGNQDALVRGETHHMRQAAFEQRMQTLITVGRISKRKLQCGNRHGSAASVGRVRIADRRRTATGSEHAFELLREGGR